MSEVVDVVIVGGGAAGLSAAVMLGRSRRSVVVVDEGRPRNRFAPHMHGLIGRDGDSPARLLDDGRRDAGAYGVRLVDGRVTSIEGVEGCFVVHGPQQLTARRVIIATGLVDVLPEIAGVDTLWGTGAVGCPYCDGWEVRDEPLGVIATSPMSRNQAHLLRQWTPDLTVFGAHEAGIVESELDGLEARGITLAPPALSVRGELGDVRIATVAGEHRLTRVFVGARPQPADALLTSLGAERLETSGPTSVPGVWAIGNVADQKALVPIALGAGTQAAMQVNISLLEEEIARVQRPR